MTAALRRTVAALVAICMLPVAANAQVPSLRAGDGEWLYLLESRNTDATREAEFNRWYDEIDIPDVLGVPGFKRARRGKILDIDDLPKASAEKAAGEYIAIYNIDTENIDRTIAELYDAARVMSAKGRDSELLKVTEANYYRATAGYAFRSGEKSQTYLAVQKILCCVDRTREEPFVKWVSDRFFGKLKRNRKIGGAILYKSYRTIISGDQQGSHFVIVYEINGVDFSAILNGGYLESQSGDDAAPRFVIGSTAIFRKVADKYK